MVLKRFTSTVQSYMNIISLHALSYTTLNIYLIYPVVFENVHTS